MKTSSSRLTIELPRSDKASSGALEDAAAIRCLCSALLLFPCELGLDSHSAKLASLDVSAKLLNQGTYTAHYVYRKILRIHYGDFLSVFSVIHPAKTSGTNNTLVQFDHSTMNSLPMIFK